MQKGEFLPEKFFGMVVLHESKQFCPPDGVKKFGWIALEIKNNNSSKNFGTKQGAKKKKYW